MATPIQVMTIGHLVERWQDTRNQSFLDDAVIYCDANNLDVLPALREVLAEAARQRLGRKVSKAVREGVKDHCFRMMANLVIAGISLREASEKAAVYSTETPHSLRASSLEKEYPSVWRTGSPSLEDQLRSVSQYMEVEELEEQWRDLANALRPPTDEERGNRRF